ncbi:hypothetical protein EON82_06425 [bacterium]|nr:MAG: hypothetical protein EON82_06425 [bacterium]
MEENGPIENLQLSCLVAGFLILLFSLRRVGKLWPLIAVLCVLYLSLILREMELRGTGVSEWLVALTRRWQARWLVPLWVLALGNAWMRRQTALHAARSFDRRPLVPSSL